MLTLEEIKEKTIQRLSAVELLLESQKPESCKPCLLGNAVTLEVLGNTCKQYEETAQTPLSEKCDLILDVARTIKENPAQEGLLKKVQELKCKLLMNSEKEKETCVDFEL